MLWSPLEFTMKILSKNVPLVPFTELSWGISKEYLKNWTKELYKKLKQAAFIRFV